MSAGIPKRMQPPEEKTLFLFREDIQRSVLLLMFAAVALWVSVDVADSTILKPYFLVAFAFLLLALRLGWILGQGRVSWHRSAVDIWMVLSLLILTLSWTFSDYRIFGTTALLSAVSYTVCFFCGTQLFSGQGKADRALDVIAIVTTLVCVIGILQYFAGDDWGIDFGIGSSRRVMSTLGNSTYLAGFLAMMIPVTLGRILSGRRRNRNITWSVLLLLMAVVLFLSQSRSGIFAVVCSVFLFFVLYNRDNSRGIIISILVAGGVSGLLVLTVPGLGERLLSLLNPLEDSSFARRFPFWRAGWDAAVFAPLAGHGPGSVPFVIARFRSADYWMKGSEDIVPHVHNELLESAIESGLAGALVFAVIGFLVVRQGLRMRERLGAGLSAGLVCAMIAIFLDNMTGVSLRQPPVAMLAWFLAGLLFSPAGNKAPDVNKRLPFAGNRVTALLPLALWAVFVYFWAGNAAAKVGADQSLQSGRVAARAGEQQIAVDHFRSAVASDSTHLIASYELCVAQLRTGAYREALATAGRITELVPDYPKVRLLESLAWLELDSLRLARFAIEAELKRRDHPEAFYTQSLIAARMDDTSGVRLSLERVLQQNIAAYTTIHVEGSCRTLLEIAETVEHLQRLGSLLDQLARRVPRNDLIEAMRAEVLRRLQQKT